jgi:hypothetical protein
MSRSPLAAAAFLLVPILAGCMCGPSSGADAGVDAGANDPWTAWSEISAKLKTSPDHLVGRADAVVATRDPVKIFEFVRDAIATYPPEADGFGQALVARRWGEKGTLRGGAGTPREKADLLVSLYARAGLDAGVVRGLADPARLTGEKVLLREIDRSVVLSYTPAEAARWRTALGAEPPRQYSAIDPTRAEAASVAAALKAQLPTTLTSPFDFTLGQIPLVAVTVGGEVKFANPIAVGIPFGESATVGAPTDIAAAGPLQRVRVELTAARADAPNDRFGLLDSTFDADEVVGRRIQVSFPPPGGVEQLIRLHTKDLEAVVPVLAVVGTDLTQAERDRLVEAGDLISLSGDVYAQTGDGGLTLNGEPLPRLETDPAALARVASVQTTANPAAFPRVTLAVSALDAMGRHVPRLGASAFKVEEDGVPVSFTLQRAELKPRVVLLFDGSSSVPATFLGAGAASVGDQIVQQLYATNPNAEVRVASVYFGARFATNSWATTLAEAQAQVQTLDPASSLVTSDLWDALAVVDKEKPTLVIMITDGDASDQPTPEVLAVLSAGAPVLTLAVGTIKQAVIDQISTVTSGKSVPVVLAAEAVTAASAEIAARAQQDYLISYRAPTAGAAMRVAKVTANAQAGSASYLVPANPPIAKAIVGLYLTLTVDGRVYERPLAGFGTMSNSASRALTPAMIDDVRSLLQGGLAISVEAAAPTQSLVLDDWIAGRQTLRPLFTAIASKDADKIKAFYKQGFSVSPPRLPLAHARLPNAAGATWLTFETGLRVATLVTKTPVAKGPVQHELDLFPLSQWATAAADPRVAWEKTLEATAGLAVVEKHLLAGTSTLEGLAGKATTTVAPIAVSDQPGLTDDERIIWRRMIGNFSGYSLVVPLKPGPFWAVHQSTGTVMGVLPSGAGGAAEVCGNYDAANSALQALGLVGSLMGLSVGPWVALGQWEVKYVTVATLVIDSCACGHGTAGATPDLTNPAIDMGCAMYNDALGGALPIYGTIDTVVGTYNTINPDHALPTLCAPTSMPGPCH